MEYGDPDGHGRYGILDTDTEGLLICHDCGQAWKHLATHVRLAHGHRAAQYREAHGLPRSLPLVAPVVSDRLRAAWEQNADTHLADLAAHRDPARATQASRGIPWAVGTKARQAQAAKARASRDLTPAEIAQLGNYSDIPEWSKRTHALLATYPELSKRAVARSLGVPVVTVEQRLRRYPA